MSTQIITLIYILIIIFLCNKITYQKDYSSAWDIINEVEELAKKGALRAQILFEKRCESDIDACKYKQYDSCSTKMPDGMEIVHEELYLEGCDVKGMYVNYHTSGARCDNNEDCDSYDNKRIICSQAELFYDFYQYQYQDQDQTDNQNNDSDEDEDEDEDQENQIIIEQISIEDYEGLSDKIIEKYDPQLTSIKQAKDSQIVYQYAGFRNSYFNIYPFYHRPFVCDQCQEYDPRSRSWYIGGVTGAKNLVLILDISQSMAGKMNMAKNAALTVVESLTYSDYFQLILFNDDAETITGENVLIQATIENKAKFTSLIEEIQEKGGTNFEAAFVKAFNIMDETFDDESSGSDTYKNCLNVILFMTDGKISSGEDNQSLLLNMIATRNSYYKAFIFTYSLGTDADVDLPNQISCENRGIWFQVLEDSEDSLKTTMAFYYVYLATGIDLEYVMWSEIYKSSSLQKEMVTASVPIFYTENSSKSKIFLGVFGVDLLIQELDKYDDFRSQVLPQLLSRARDNCVQSTITDCQLENMRSTNCQAADICDSYPFEPPSCKKSIQEEWQLTSNSTDTGKYASLCATSDEDDFPFCWKWWHYFLIGISISIVILIVIILIYRYIQRKKRIRELEYGIGV